MHDSVYYILLDTNGEHSCSGPMDDATSGPHSTFQRLKQGRLFGCSLCLQMDAADHVLSESYLITSNAFFLVDLRQCQRQPRAHSGQVDLCSCCGPCRTSILDGFCCQALTYTQRQGSTAPWDPRGLSPSPLPAEGERGAAPGIFAHL